MDADIAKEKSTLKRTKKPRGTGKPRLLKVKKEPSEPGPGLQVQWQDIDLADVNLEDASFQFRLSATVTDVRVSLEQHGQEQPVDLVGSKPYRIVDGFRRCVAA